jgi:acetyl esterase/lipase
MMQLRNSPSRLLPGTLALLLATGSVSCGERHKPANGPGEPTLRASHQQVLDRPYVRIAGRTLQLDVYLPPGGRRLMPTVLYFHGGGWIQGSKEGFTVGFERFMSAGWAVVKPSYRLAPESPAPAALEDAVCALRWIGTEAGEYGFDPNQVVTMGFSAGGHLALMLGMLPDSRSLAANCPGPAVPRPVAVVSLAGITDLPDLVEGTNRRDWAMTWAGNGPHRDRLLRALSPLSQVRPGVAPVITVHGDIDDVVPYDQAVRLHAALDRASVPNQLVPLAGEGHTIRQPHRSRALDAVMDFLREQGVTAVDDHVETP